MEKICFIYKIFCLDGDIGDVYIGSTSNQRISDRFSGHKTHYKNWKEGIKTHMTSFILFDKYGPENCVIEVLEQFAYDKNKIKERERYHIDINLCINIQLPGRSRKQYAIDNKEHLKLKALEYKKNNLIEINAKKKAYRDSHKEEYKAYCVANAEKFKKPIECECGSVVVTRNYCLHIKTQLHLDYLKTGVKKPETIPLNQVINCGCGKKYTYSNRLRHLKTKKHTDYLATINNIDIIQNDTENSKV